MFRLISIILMSLNITKHIKSGCKDTKKRRIIRNYVPYYYDTLMISGGNTWKK